MATSAFRQFSDRNGRHGRIDHKLRHSPNDPFGHPFSYPDRLGRGGRTRVVGGIRIRHQVPDQGAAAQRRAPDGACCPRGYRWDTTVRTCIQPGPWCYRARENFTVEIYPCCPGGYWPSVDGAWECPPRITAPPAAATVPSPPCPTGSFRNASGKCITTLSRRRRSASSWCLN